MITVLCVANILTELKFGDLEKDRQTANFPAMQYILTTHY